MSKVDKLREFFRYVVADTETWVFCDATALLEDYFAEAGLDWRDTSVWDAWFPAAETAFEAEDGR